MKRHTFPPALPPEDPDEFPLEDAALERTLSEIAEEARLAAEEEKE